MNDELRSEGMGRTTDRATRTPRTSRAVRATSAVAVAVGLAVGAGAVAGAATNSAGSSTVSAPSASTSKGVLPPPGGPGRAVPTVVGTVAAVGTGSFTVTTSDGSSVTVDVSSSTAYQDSAMTAGSLSDVSVGEHVAVLGTEASGTVTATTVQLGTPPTGAPAGSPNAHGDGPPPPGATSSSVSG